MPRRTDHRRRTPGKSDLRFQGPTEEIPKGLSDIDLANALANRGWAPITRDRHIRSRLAERQAFANAGLPLFVLTSRRNLSRAEIVEQIALAAPKIATFLAKHEPPFIAAIHSNGNVVLR